MGNGKSKKNITIEYFALLREQRGCQTETVLTEVETAAELFEDMKAKYSFSLTRSNLRVAINKELRDWTNKLENNDVVVFLPPVAGG